MNPHIRISLHKCSLQGMRPSNEDEISYHLHGVSQFRRYATATAPVDVFVICDGHGGDQVSKFVAPKLKAAFINPALRYPLPRCVIIRIFDTIQENLIQHPQDIAADCGSTALVVIRYLDIYGKSHLQIINAGDCRAVLSRSGLAIPLSKDHKPSWPEETARIHRVNKEIGTNVSIQRDTDNDDEEWRINGLSVSRSFGDLYATPYVTHQPEIFEYALCDEDEFVIMGCDGVWDVLQNHEAVNFVSNNLKKPPVFTTHRIGYGKECIYPTKAVINSENIAYRLGEYAIAKESGDNISILILIFGKYQ